MSVDPKPVRAAGLLLPESVKQHLRPWWHRASARLAGEAAYRFEYRGEQYQFEPTPETAWTFRDAVSGGVLRHENVSLDLLADAGMADRIIDVGAHNGLYTVLLRKLNPEAHIVAFEPERRNREICRRVLLANNVDAAVRREVVADHGGNVTFYVAPEHGSESHTLTPTPGFEAVSKPAAALSTELRDVDSAWLKIDAEGGEWPILRDLFTADADLAGLVELHPEKLPVAVADVLALLERECATVERLGDSSPEHPAAASIEFEDNRPMYRFER